MSTDVIQNTNKLIEAAASFVVFLEKENLEEVRSTTEFNWQAKSFKACHAGLESLLIAKDLAYKDSGGFLHATEKGFAFLGKVLIDLDKYLRTHEQINNRYTLIKKLAAGKNSIAYQARDDLLGSTVVLKFFRPGRGKGIIENVSKVGALSTTSVLVHPLNLCVLHLADTHNNLVRIDVLVFPYVDGVTLREYIATEQNSSPVVVEAFIEQIAGALSVLHEAGLYHGDLHPNNILVTSERSGKIGFRLIDISYGTDEPSEFEMPSTDMEGFKFILNLALNDIQRRLVSLSLRKYLGARIFTLVQFILSEEDISFASITDELTIGSRFTRFNQAKEEFIRTKFQSPRDFGILRYEEFSNPNVAIKLFYPFPELFERLCAFGSAALLGHRGTGKSTYMAAMNFFPEVSDPPVKFKENFGILFSCRQGEFRKFSNRNLRRPGKVQIKDILITKIIRKTLSLLVEGVAQQRIRPPKSVRPMAEVLLSRIQHTQGIIVSHQLSELASLKSTVLSAEIHLIDKLFANEQLPPESKLLDEHSLGQFFESVRQSFSDLNLTRFSILFDDAGAPNIPTDVQSLICDLMASTNSVYCVKISAEKKTFDFVTTDKKPIERVHDVKVYTISDYFSMGSGFAIERKEVEEYFRKLVNIRLAICQFKSSEIRDYLGDEATPMGEIVKKLVSNNQDVTIYGGWQHIWQIADRTTRHLIEMISAIFDESKTLPDKPPAIISNHIQSRQIVRFSGDKLRSLMLLPGTLEVSGKKQPLGKLLYEFAASFGKVSRHYLLVSANQLQPERYDERLAIELDNTLSLNPDAKKILDALIRFAVLDDEKMATSLDDGLRKPIYIFNRVYCPVLRISFRRADHWRLSSNRLEKFLMNPTGFVKNDSRLSKLLAPGKDYEQDLFGGA